MTDDVKTWRGFSVVVDFKDFHLSIIGGASARSGGTVFAPTVCLTRVDATDALLVVVAPFLLRLFV